MNTVGGLIEMPIMVLLVEDSPGDVRLTREAFHEANTIIELYVATDGLEATAFLRISASPCSWTPSRTS